MRKAIDGLSMLVYNTMEMNPTNGEVYVFWNYKRDKLKILYWHINGFCMLYKRLEKERFKVPKDLPTVLAVTSKELRWLLEGLDFTKIDGHKELKYDIFC